MILPAVIRQHANDFHENNIVYHYNRACIYINTHCNSIVNKVIEQFFLYSGAGTTVALHSMSLWLFPH